MSWVPTAVEGEWPLREVQQKEVEGRLPHGAGQAWGCEVQEAAKGETA
jgi:hypothetical protein